MRYRMQGAWVVAIALIIMALAATAAYATATSGRQNLGQHPSNGFLLCGEAVIRDVADNVAYSMTVFPLNSCWNSGANSQSGWLGARADGFREGAYCSTTGYAYNSGQTWLFGVGSVLCSNPVGLQAFHTKSYHRAWDVTTSQYVYMGTATSPNQSY